MCQMLVLDMLDIIYAGGFTYKDYTSANKSLISLDIDPVARRFNLETL